MSRRDMAALRLAASRENQVAAKIISRARGVTGMNQAEFAEAIADRLAVPRYGQAALSGWETGKRPAPAAVMIAAASIAKDEGLEMAAVIEKQIEEIARMPVPFFYWVTAQMTLGRRLASPQQQEAFRRSIIGADNSRFKKQSEVAWRDDHTAVVSMAAAGGTIQEVREAVINMVKRHAVKAAKIAPEHEVGVAVLGTQPI